MTCVTRKISKYVLALVVVLFFLSNSARSSHISGMNVSYECLGGNEYLVSVNLFRDCYEAQFLPASINVFISSSCNTVGWEDFYQVSLQEVSQLCDAQLPFSTCNGGNLPGVQLGVYQNTLTLDPCSDWRIIVAEQNRDESIANLQNPELTNVHVEALLNNSDGDCNSSPALSVVNLPYVCVASPLFYNLGFIDPDGDSLAYSLVPALASFSPLSPYELTYSGAYSGAEPITGISINAVTGQIEVTPNFIGNFNAVVEVEEYRNGVLIGVVRYDFLFLINACATPPPNPVEDSFENISGGAYALSESTIGVCANDDFCFTIDFESQDPSVNVALTTNISEIIPGTTTTQTGTNPATLQFCGTIPPGFTGGQFLITALDDACPVYGQAYYAMEFVFRQPLEVMSDMVLCEGELANVSAQNDTLYNWFHANGDLLDVGTEASCNPCQYNDITADTTSWYIVEGLYANSTCSNRDSIFIEVPLDMNISISPETCIGDDGEIDIEILSGSNDYFVEWTDIGVGPLTRSGLVDGSYQVFIRDNVYGCEKLLDLEIIQMVMPTSNAGVDQEICGLTAELLATSSTGVAEWTAINGGVFDDDGAEDSSVEVPSQGVYDFVWTENSGGGCLDSDTVRVTFFEMPGVAITAADSVCGLMTELGGAVVNGSFTWEAPFEMSISDSTLANIDADVPTYGTYEITLNAQNGVCSESNSHEFVFIETPVTSVVSDLSVCDSIAEVQGNETVGTGYWEIPLNLSTADEITANTIGLQSANYGMYNVIRKSEHHNFCFDSDTLSVRFVEQPLVTLGFDLIECSSETVLSFTLPVGDLSWNLSENLTPISTVQTPTTFEGSYGNHTAILNADNGYGCVDSDTLNITLIEQPIASIISADTICGLFAQLNATGNADVTYWAEAVNADFSDESDAQSDVEVNLQGDYLLNWVLENGGVCRDTVHYPVLFYNQPIAEAGADKQICGLTALLDAVPSYGVLEWTQISGVNFDDVNDAQTSITADWYGQYLLEVIETNGICFSKDTVAISLISTPEIQNEVWECTGADAMFTLQFELAYGDSSAHEVSGLEGEVEDFVFTSTELLSNTAVQVFLNDNGLCGGDTLTGTMFCPVITSAGVLSSDTIWVCASDMAQASTVLAASSDSNDTLLYALHSSSTNVLGTVMDWNNTPEFDFYPSYPYETAFYISAVVGNAIPGGVDLDDPNLSVSAGTPVVFKEEPSAQIAGSLTVCPNEELYIPVDLTGTGDLILDYTLNGTALSLQADDTEFFIPLTADGIYELTAIQSGFCEGTVNGQVVVDYFPLPTAVLGGPAEICFGDTASLEISLLGNGPYSFDIVSGGQTVQSYVDVESPVTYITTDGGEFLIVNISDVNCHQGDTTSKILLVKPLPIVNAGEDMNFCSGDTVLLGTPAIAGQDYDWQPSAGLLETDSAQVLYTLSSEVSFGESQNLVLTAEINGCSQSDTLIATVYGEPLASIEGPSQVCNGDSILLTAFGGDAVWSPADWVTDSASTSTYFVGSADTIVQIVITTPFGCISQAEHAVEVLSVPNAEIGASQMEGCIPFSAEFSTLFPEFGETYQWEQNGEIAGLNHILQRDYNEVGLFEISVLVTGLNGCTSYQTIETPVVASTTFADFEFDDFNLSLSNTEVYFNNLSPFDVQSQWTVDTLTQVNIRNLSYMFPDMLGSTYLVCLDVLNPYGCADRFCDEVFIKDNFQIYVPNSFTPNGDGINDEFYPTLSHSDVFNYHFWIMDSKGTIVFDTDDPRRKWDGKNQYGNAMSENSIFLWHVDVMPFGAAETRAYTGHVTLLR